MSTPDIDIPEHLVFAEPCEEAATALVMYGNVWIGGRHVRYDAIAYPEAPLSAPGLDESMARHLNEAMERAGYDTSLDRAIPSPFNVSGLDVPPARRLPTLAHPGTPPIDRRKRKRLQKLQKAARRANR